MRKERTAVAMIPKMPMMPQPPGRAGSRELSERKAWGIIEVRRNFDVG
jgi:hypothetical protein